MEGFAVFFFNLTGCIFFYLINVEKERKIEILQRDRLFMTLQLKTASFGKVL